MSTRAFHPRPRRNYMVAAVVLGTALSAFGSDRAAAAETPAQAMNDIGKYCTSCWRNARLPADAWSDCTQEVFKRLLERVPTERWALTLQGEGEERLEFLRAIDAVKKRTQRARRYSSAVEGAADPRQDNERSLAEDRETVRLAARELLSPRQQRILQLSLEGWSVPDIGKELLLPVERVSDEKYKAIRRLRAQLGTGPVT
jgi:RNA polymerase sigma factor (sigma-70 family)